MANDNEITQLEQVKARLAEINRMKADGRRLTREELEEFQRLTVEMDDLLSSSTARVESLQKEVAILDQYLAKVQGLNKSADGLLLNREVQTEQLRNQYELEQQLVKLQDEITQADLDRLKNKKYLTSFKRITNQKIDIINTISSLITAQHEFAMCSKQHLEMSWCGTSTLMRISTPTETLSIGI